MTKKLLTFALACFLFIVAHAQPPIGMQCPTIELRNAQDSLISTASLKGKVVIIDFWASWCGPCRLANKTLRKLYNKYKDKGLEIYSISEDYTTAHWKQGAKVDKITWLSVFDPGGVVANKWHIGYLPFTFVIDKSGLIHAADLEAKQLEAVIQQLL